jgi:hypothetical protein
MTFLKALAKQASSLFAAPEPNALHEGLDRAPDFTRGRYDDAAGACFEKTEEEQRHDWLRAHTVEVCQRPMNLPLGEYLPIAHEYLRTPSGKEAGLGPAENGGDYPFSPVTITDHSAEPDDPVWGCKPVPADAACVDQELDRLAGADLGRWSPWNNCWTIVESILEKCKLPEALDPYADNRSNAQIEAELSELDDGFGL